MTALVALVLLTFSPDDSLVSEKVTATVTSQEACEIMKRSIEDRYLINKNSAVEYHCMDAKFYAK